MALTESDIKIIISGELKKAGFDKAKKATNQLEDNFKKLGRTIALTFSVAAVTKFAKESVKAFKEDEIAARRFEQALQGVNLGFATPEIENYLEKLERSTAVTKNELRPAFQTLAQTTRSLVKSEELLGIALDVAAGSGYNLNTVVNDLSRAYLGNNVSLAKYNLGLSKAELRTTSFNKVQELLSQQFAGQKAAQLETYAGKVALVQAAYERMQTSVGEGLVDAFGMLAGENGIEGATNAMEEFGIIAADVTRGLGYYVGQVTRQISGQGGLLANLQSVAMTGNPLAIALVALQKAGAKTRPLFFPTAGIGQPGIDAKNKALEEARLKREKQLEALRLKTLKAQEKADRDKARREREQQALRRAGTVFDIENAQILAALQGNIDEQQRLRLTTLLALNTKNAELAEKLSAAVLATQSAALQSVGAITSATKSVDDLINEILVAQTKIALVGTSISTLPKAKNPFADWESVLASIINNIGSIPAAPNPFERWDDVIDSLTAKIAKMKTDIQAIAESTTGDQTAKMGTLAEVLTAQQQEFLVYNIASSIANEAFKGSVLPPAEFAYEFTTLFEELKSILQGQLGNVTVNVTGSVITQTDLEEQLRLALLKFQQSGQVLVWSNNL